MGDTESGTADLSRQLLVALAVLPMIGALAFVAPPLFFPEMADDLGTTVPLLGQLTTGILLIGGIFALIAGPIADRRGLRRPVAFAALAAALCLGVMAIAPSYRVLLLAAPFGGIADGGLTTLSLAAAATVPTAARSRALGIVTASLAGAGIIGGPVLGLLGSITSWRGVFALCALVALAGVVLALVAYPEGTIDPDAATSMRGAYGPLLQNRQLRIYFLSTVLRAAGWLGFVTYVASFVQEDLGLSSRLAGFAYLLGGGGFLVGSLVAGPVLARLTPRAGTALATAAIGIVAAVVMSGQLGVPVSFALIFVVAFTAAISWIGFIGLVVDASTGGNAATLAVNGAMLALGAAAGSLFGGLLLAAGGYAVLGLGMAVATVVAGIMVGRSNRPVSPARAVA